jgi:hypothetical protein
MFTSAAGNPMDSPIDIGGGSGGAALNFYTNSNVKSIYIQWDDFSGPGCQSPYGQVVVVKMFSAINTGGVFIGAVAYQHVDNRLAAGTIRNYPGGAYWSVQVGTMLSSLCGSGCCYAGVHTHMERDGGDTNTFLCNAAITGGGGTWIYHWAY